MSEGNLKSNKQQRKRAQNFSEAEKMILTDLVLQYKDVIENKKSDAVTSKDKDKCWKTIEIAFNSRSSAECRSSEVLRSYWDNLKKKQESFLRMKKCSFKTGKFLFCVFMCIHIVYYQFIYYKSLYYK